MNEIIPKGSFPIRDKQVFINTTKNCQLYSIIFIFLCIKIQKFSRGSAPDPKTFHRKMTVAPHIVRGGVACVDEYGKWIT